MNESGTCLDSHLEHFTSPGAIAQMLEALADDLSAVVQPSASYSSLDSAGFAYADKELHNRLLNTVQHAKKYTALLHNTFCNDAPLPKVNLSQHLERLAQGDLAHPGFVIDLEENPKTILRVVDVHPFDLYLLVRRCWQLAFAVSCYDTLTLRIDVAATTSRAARIPPADRLDLCLSFHFLRSNNRELTPEERKSIDACVDFVSVWADENRGTVASTQRNADTLTIDLYLPSNTTQQRTKPTPAASEPRSIFILEPDCHVRKLLDLLARKEQFHTVLFSTWDDLLCHVQSGTKNVACVIFDRPKTNTELMGYLDELSKSCDSSKLLLLSTSWDSPPPEIQERLLGFLPKPFAPENLFSFIDRL